MKPQDFRRRAFKQGVRHCAHCGLEVYFHGIGGSKQQFLKRIGIPLGLEGRSKFTSLFRATTDHIIPISRGGSKTSASNMQILCSLCNTEKGNMLEEELFEESEAT